MEPNDVLKIFLQKCCEQPNEFRDNNYASNAVLEWFGRTIRGSTKIKNYYR